MLCLSLQVSCTRPPGCWVNSWKAHTGPESLTSDFSKTSYPYLEQSNPADTSYYSSGSPAKKSFFQGSLLSHLELCPRLLVTLYVPCYDKHHISLLIPATHLLDPGIQRRLPHCRQILWAAWATREAQLSAQPPLRARILPVSFVRLVGNRNVLGTRLINEWVNPSY